MIVGEMIVLFGDRWAGWTCLDGSFQALLCSVYPADPSNQQQAGDPRNKVQQQQEQQQEPQRQQPSRVSEPAPLGNAQQATEQEPLW